MKRLSRACVLGLALVTGGALAWTTGCDTSSSAVKEPAPGSGPPADTGGTTPDAGGDGGKDCFDDPKTHFEIINACTNATRITKNPTLGKLTPDGGLPPLN